MTVPAPCCRVAITVTPVGEPATGLWCPRCLLPSGIAGDALIELDATPHGTVRHAWCLECGACLDTTAWT